MKLLAMLKSSLRDVPFEDWCPPYYRELALEYEKTQARRRARQAVRKMRLRRTRDLLAHLIRRMGIALRNAR